MTIGGLAVAWAAAAETLRYVETTSWSAAGDVDLDCDDDGRQSLRRRPAMLWSRDRP